jgi:hypothetical protein
MQTRSKVCFAPQAADQNGRLPLEVATSEPVGYR